MLVFRIYYNVFSPFSCKFPTINSCSKYITSFSKSICTSHSKCFQAKRRLLPSCFTPLNDFVISRSVCINHKQLLSYGVDVCACGLKYTSLRQMAGHSKWQNIKHTKVSKDQEKAKLCSRYSRLTRIAVRENGADPKFNHALRSVMEEARKNNIPLSVIENAMKKGSNAKTKFGFVEILGPGGCFIILDYETDNISTMRHQIKCVLKKYNCNIMQGEGRWRAAFEQKGIVKVIAEEGQVLDAEKALDSAIEVGAENVQLQVDDENKEYLEFLCDPSELHMVKKGLENMQYKIEDSYTGFIPNVTVQLAAEDMVVVENMLSELLDLEDVVHLFENVQQ